MPESVTVDRLLPFGGSENHTAAYKIFNYQFLCRIPQMFLYSEEYIRENGMLTTGNAERDRATAKAMTDVRLTIAAMATYQMEGAPLELLEPSDSAKIYRIIKEHLDNWLEEVRYNPHRLDSPHDDMLALDQLATYVYPYARFYLQENPTHGRLQNALAALLQARGGLSRGNAQPSIPTDPRANMPTQHTPMADSINNEALSRRKAWDSKTPR